MENPIEKLGLVYWGCLFSTGLFGVSLMQAYTYFSKNEDSLPLKTFVTTIMILQIISMALQSQIGYHYLVQNFGQYSIVHRWTVTFIAEMFTSNLICFLEGTLRSRTSCCSSRCSHLLFSFRSRHIDTYRNNSSRRWWCRHATARRSQNGNGHPERLYSRFHVVIGCYFNWGDVFRVSLFYDGLQTVQSPCRQAYIHFVAPVDPHFRSSDMSFCVLCRKACFVVVGAIPLEYKQSACCVVIDIAQLPWKTAYASYSD